MLKVAIIKASKRDEVTLEKFQNHELMLDYTHHVSKQGLSPEGVIIHHKGVPHHESTFEYASETLKVPQADLDYVIELYDSFRE